MQHAIRCASLLAVTFLSVFTLADAQSSNAAAPHAAAAASKVGCNIDKSEPSDADIAWLRGDLKKAEPLYAAAIAKNPTDSRSRELQIDSLIGQQKLDEAHTLLDAWVADDGEDSYAAAAGADIRFAEGDWLESYALNLKALKLDPCNADAFSDSADYESLAGFRATAHRHYGVAHQLEPKDEDFYRHWVDGLPESQQIEEKGKYLATSKLLTEKQRTAITRDFDKATALSENHCELVSSKGPAVIPMVPMYNGGMDPRAYGLEISFNGHKRTLQIDTGAGGFLLTHSAGSTLSMPNVLKSRVGGFGSEGPNDIELDRADTVRIGGLEFRGCTVSVLTSYGAMGGSHIEGNPMDSSDGIVGSNIFDRYLVTLDYIKHEVRLAPLPQPPNAPTTVLDPLGGSNDPDRMNVDRYIAPSMKNWTQIYRRGHLLYVPTRINGTINKPFIVDTGNFINLIDTNLAKTITKTQTGILRTRGLSGVSDNLSEAGSFTADFAGIRLPVKSMDAQNLSHWGDGTAGFLGFPTLEQLVMHIDYRDNLVLFEGPAAKK